MAAVTALRKPPSTATPERQALADRIAVRNASDKDFAALTAALEWNGSVKQAMNSARRTIEATSEAIKEAVRRAAVDKALGIEAPPEVSIEELRATQAAAQSALEAALVDKEAVEARLNEETERRRFTPDFGVRAAAVAVLAAESTDAVAALVDRLEAAQREIMAAGQALIWLDRAGVVERGKVPLMLRSDVVIDERTRLVLGRMNVPPAEWPYDLAAHLPWVQALDALMADATASLP
jgi:predicted Zn-dependent protease